KTERGQFPEYCSGKGRDFRQPMVLTDEDKMGVAHCVSEEISARTVQQTAPALADADRLPHRNAFLVESCSLPAQQNGCRYQGQEAETNSPHAVDTRPVLEMFIAQITLLNVISMSILALKILIEPCHHVLKTRHPVRGF